MSLSKLKTVMVPALLVVLISVSLGCGEPAREKSKSQGEGEVKPTVKAEVKPITAAPADDTKLNLSDPNSSKVEATPTPKKNVTPAKKVRDALAKAGVFVSEESDGWNVDLSSAKDFDAAMRWLPELPRIVAITGGKGTVDAHLAVFAKLDGLRRLKVGFNENITDAGLESIKGLTKLTHLNLIYAKKITAAGVAHLAGMTELQSLNLVHIPLGKGGTKHLAKMTRLTELQLEGCKLTDIDLLPLTAMSELRILNLDRNEDIAAPGLKSLAGLRKLEELNLTGAAANDEALRHLSRLTNLHNLKVDFTAITDQGLLHLAKMTKMVYLKVGNTKVKGPGLKHLADMTDLVSLDLDGLPDFTGEGLQHLAGCNKMTELNLSWTGVTDDGLGQIKKLAQLKKLDLPPYGHRTALGGDFWKTPHPERFSDKGLKHVGEMTNLEWLWFGGAITDAGLAHLSKLKNLKYLGFGDLPAVKGPGLEYLKALPKIQGLELKDTGISDDEMKHVKVLTQLQRLELPLRATDAALEHVKAMKNLKSVRVFGGISEKGRADLKKALPDANVEVEN